MIERDLFAYLAAAPSLSAVVGSRISALVVPQASAFPAVVYQVINEERGATLCGVDSSVKLLAQFDCYAKTFDGAAAAAKALRDLLIDFSGAMGDTRVDRVAWDSRSDSTDPEPGLFRVSQTFIFFYQEP